MAKLTFFLTFVLNHISSSKNHLYIIIFILIIGTETIVRGLVQIKFSYIKPNISRLQYDGPLFENISLKVFYRLSKIVSSVSLHIQFENHFRRFDCGWNASSFNCKLRRLIKLIINLFWEHDVQKFWIVYPCFKIPGQRKLNYFRETRLITRSAAV